MSSFSSFSFNVGFLPGYHRWHQRFLWLWGFHKSSENWLTNDFSPGHFSDPERLWPFSTFLGYLKGISIPICARRGSKSPTSHAVLMLLASVNGTTLPYPLSLNSGRPPWSALSLPLNDPNLVYFLNPTWTGPLFAINPTMLIIALISLRLLWCPHSAVYTTVRINLLKCKPHCVMLCL